MDAQDIQDFLARVSTTVRSTIVQASTGIPNPAPELLESLEDPPDR